MLPWEATGRLNEYASEVRSGAWSWRLYTLGDGGGGVGDLQGCVSSLIITGEEFSVQVWRPHLPDGEGLLTDVPADFRKALVTWGPYLDMTTEEIVDKMVRTYGEGHDGSVGGQEQSSGSVAVRQAADPAQRSGEGWFEPDRPGGEPGEAR